MVLDAAANSVVCTESTDMLSTLFGRTPANVFPMTFVSHTWRRFHGDGDARLHGDGDAGPMTFVNAKCERVRSRCDECLRRVHCQTHGTSLSTSVLTARFVNRPPED